MTRLDLLFERLRLFDEVQLCELLDISSEDILERFYDLVLEREEYLRAEIEIIPESDEEIEDDEMDGFQPFPDPDEEGWTNE